LHLLLELRLIKNLKFFINIILFCKLLIFISLRRTSKIYFVDIDNTLSDTWPTINNDNYTSEHERLKSLPIFIGMKKYLSKEVTNNKNLLVFLSARNYKFYSITYEWLISNGFNNFCLILVNSAYEKPFFITTFLLKKYDKVIIDDLSYNHENKNLLFYADVIKIYKNLNYIDFYEINKINNNVYCQKTHQTPT